MSDYTEADMQELAEQQCREAEHELLTVIAKRDEQMDAIAADMALVEAVLDQAQAERRKWLAAMQLAVALSDTGSVEHKAKFGPDYGHIVGWRVVEAMREALLDAMGNEPIAVAPTPPTE